MRLALVLALALLAQPEPPPAPGPAANKLRPGLSQDQARQLLGQPTRIARQALAQRYLEQWTYEHPHFLRLEFDCPRGQPAVLQAIRPLRPAGP